MDFQILPNYLFLKESLLEMSVPFPVHSQQLKILGCTLFLQTRAKRDAQKYFSFQTIMLDTFLLCLWNIFNDALS